MMGSKQVRREWGTMVNWRYLTPGRQVVVMQTLLTDESVTPSTFSLGQWIKVTSQPAGLPPTS